MASSGVAVGSPLVTSPGQSADSNGGATLSTNSGRTNSSRPDSSRGCLKATILSAYDLPVREPPLYVSVSVKHKSAQTGPPVQRHKDRNSFRFQSTPLEVVAPLPKLYESTAVIELVYEDESKTLRASYALDQLKIHETTWLILHLDNDNGQNSTADINNEDDLIVRPTLRLQMTLSGPYRTEIDATIRLAEAWFGLVDGAEATSRQAIQRVPTVSVDPKWILVPVVPVAALAVVSAPVLLGVLTVSLPLVLPFLLAASIVLVAMGAAVAAVYSSTAHGREQLGHLFGPLAHTMLSTKSGQSIVYQTGPRPSPVQLAEAVLPTAIWHKLIVSLLIDLIGSSSYLIPLAGESFDIMWAPTQTILIMAMYDDVSPNLKYISFVEELLPLTDIVPSATMGWLTEFGLPLVTGGLNNDLVDVSVGQIVEETKRD